MLWGKANSISFCSITVSTPKLGEIMNWLKPVIAVRWRKPSIMKMAAFPTFQIARGGVASEGRNRGLMWLQGELRVSQLEDQNWLERGAWSSSSRLLISGWTTDMQASLSRSNPKIFSAIRGKCYLVQNDSYVFQKTKEGMAFIILLYMLS